MVHGLKLGFGDDEQRRCEKQVGWGDCASNLDGNIQSADLFHGTNIHLWCVKRSSGSTEQTDRLQRLVHNRRCFCPYSTSLGTVQHRSFCLQPQQKASKIQFEIPQRGGRSGERLLAGLGGDSQLLLRGVRNYSKSYPSRHRMQGGGSYCGTKMGSQTVVEDITENCNKVDGSQWKMFCEGADGSRGTLQSVLENGSSACTWSTSFLSKVCRDIKLSGVQPSTDKTYKTYRRKFSNFFVRRNLPISIDSVQQFFTELFCKSRSGNVVRLAYFGILHRASALGWSQVINSLLSAEVKALRTATMNVSPVAYRIHRDPFPLLLVKKFIRSLGVGWVYADFVRTCAFILIGMRTMARGGELARLTSRDISLFGNEVIVDFTRTKTRKFGRKVRIQASGSSFCPVMWLKKWLAIRPRNATRLFLLSSTFQISELLMRVAASMKWKGKFTSHSIRIGSASEAAMAGFSKEWIKIMGDWSGPSVDRYLRADTRFGRNLTVLFGL
ncbi:hypothetical protein AKO1_011666 [Acrasis kona]|uniref:Tyr recombinase domain-containing protein n=1 Tax=Acrasis kona TaxID=1008807 RepID=A0AAW2Z651_9EUKA